jgi:hypothetical protein
MAGISRSQHVDWRYRCRRVRGSAAAVMATQPLLHPVKHQPSLSTPASFIACIKIMVFFSGFALCAAITGAGALQIPLLSSTNQAPLGGSKPLINSTELQDLISGERLMTRANKLFEIAKLGEEEYNHPTRVIGSAGMLMHVLSCDPSADHVCQVMSERCRTSMRRF